MENAMNSAERALAALLACEDETAVVEERAAAARKESTAPAKKGTKNNKNKKSSRGKQDKTNLKEWSPIKELPEGVTSLMLRNLPFEISQRDLLDELCRFGFSDRCDFCYMPCNFVTGENKGNAYVNFTSAAAAVEFSLAWRGRPKCAGYRPRQGLLDISVADVQGLAANVEKFDNPRMTRVRNPNFRPFLLSGAQGR